MSYDKGSFESFKASLKIGKYETATGARRAIGKLSQFSADDKEKARKLVDAHFGETSSSSPKATKAPVGEKRKPGRPPRAGVAAAPVAVVEKRKPGRPARAVQTTVLAGLPVALQGMALEDLQIGERVVTAATQALSTLEGVKNAFEGTDALGAAREYTKVLASSVGLFRRVVAERMGTSAKQGPGDEESEETEDDHVPNGARAAVHQSSYFPDMDA